MEDLALIPRHQLEQLQRSPMIGDAMKERIAGFLGQTTAASASAPRSTDPRDRMTKAEQHMADVLDLRKRQGEIVEWWFECMTFRVGAGRTHYRPDFVALLADGSIEAIEVKGRHIWDDAKVKFKTAAMLYPFARWRMMQLVDGEWKKLFDLGGS